MTGLSLAQERPQRSYSLRLLSFFVFLTVLLLTLVEMRRGILFPLGEYVKVGAPSAVLYLDLRQLPLLLVGAFGVWFSYRTLANLERSGTVPLDLRQMRTLLGTALMALLVIDLFTYRGVPASRIITSGSASVGQVFSWAGLPMWLRPLGEAANYLALVWHATTVAILIGGLFLVLAGGLVQRVLMSRRFLSHLGGALLALPYPFCSCCAAPVGATLLRRGAAPGPTLAFMVASPMCNVTTMVLTLALLPVEYALLRIIGGVLLAVVATYAVSRLASQWGAAMQPGLMPASTPGLLSRVADGFTNLFRFERLVEGMPADTPGALLAGWAKSSWGLARVAVPVLFLGAVLGSALVGSVPATNDVSGVLLAAALGTLLMIPTWTEVAVAAPLIRDGLTGPAAALLLTLPAVSLPSLLMVAGALRDYRTPCLLALAVFLVGAAAGLAFL